jgi:hypothetical protein
MVGRIMGNMSITDIGKGIAIGSRLAEVSEKVIEFAEKA